jgi:hypothetical protein
MKNKLVLNDDVLVGYNTETDEYEILVLAGPEAHNPPKLICIPAYFIGKVFQAFRKGGIED